MAGDIMAQIRPGRASRRCYRRRAFAAHRRWRDWRRLSLSLRHRRRITAVRTGQRSRVELSRPPLCRVGRKRLRSRQWRSRGGRFPMLCLLGRPPLLPSSPVGTRGGTCGDPACCDQRHGRRDTSGQAASKKKKEGRFDDLHRATMPRCDAASNRNAAAGRHEKSRGDTGADPPIIGAWPSFISTTPR